MITQLVAHFTVLIIIVECIKTWLYTWSSVTSETHQLHVSPPAAAAALAPVCQIPLSLFPPSNCHDTWNTQDTHCDDRQLHSKILRQEILFIFLKLFVRRSNHKLPRCCLNQPLIIKNNVYLRGKCAEAYRGRRRQDSVFCRVVKNMIVHRVGDERVVLLNSWLLKPLVDTDLIVQRWF